MITGGRGPDVPHSPERGGPSQTKKRSLGDVATPEYRQADASRRAGRLVSTSHSVVGRPSGSTVSVETRELSGAWDAGHHPCSGGVSQGGQGDIARCAMALVKGQTCRLNGPVPQTCGLGSSEGIDNTKRTLRANNSTVWVWFLPREVPAPLLSMALLGSTPNGGYLYDR